MTQAPQPGAIERLISICLGPGEPRLPESETEWEAALELALDHGVLQLLWLRVGDRDLPPPLRARLWSYYSWNRARNLELRREQTRIVASLRQRGAQALGLKGVELAELVYGDAGARHCEDMDVLVAPNELEAADAALVACGYARVSPDPLERFRRSQELWYAREDGRGGFFKLDLHLRLLPYEVNDRLAARVRAEGMTPENLLVYLAANQVAHRFARLKHLCDAVACLRWSSGRLDWERVVAAAREMEFTPGVYFCLQLARPFMPEAIPAEVFDQLRPGALSRGLARRVLGSGAAEMLARAAALGDSYGAFAVVLCTRPGLRRVKQMWRLLFPPVAYMRQYYRVAPERSATPYYFARLREKVPSAIRALWRRNP